MYSSKSIDLIDLLTLRLGEISSTADCLASTLFHEYNQDPIYKTAYAIKSMVDDLEEKVIEIKNK